MGFDAVCPCHVCCHGSFPETGVKLQFGDKKDIQCDRIRDSRKHDHIRQDSQLEHLLDRVRGFIPATHCRHAIVERLQHCFWSNNCQLQQRRQLWPSHQLQLGDVKLKVGLRLERADAGGKQTLDVAQGTLERVINQQNKRNSKTKNDNNDEWTVSR
jgi:hypothetical protein